MHDLLNHLICRMMLSHRSTGTALQILTSFISTFSFLPRDYQQYLLHKSPPTGGMTWSTSPLSGQFLWFDKLYIFARLIRCRYRLIVLIYQHQLTVWSPASYRIKGLSTPSRVRFQAPEGHAGYTLKSCLPHTSSNDKWYLDLSYALFSNV